MTDFLSKPQMPLHTLPTTPSTGVAALLVVLTTTATVDATVVAARPATTFTARTRTTVERASSYTRTTHAGLEQCMTNEASWRSRIWAKDGIVREERWRRVLLHADSDENDHFNLDTGFNKEFRVNASMLAGRCNKHDEYHCPGCEHFMFNNSAFCSEYNEGLCTSSIYVPPTTHFYDFHNAIHFIVDPVEGNSDYWKYESTCDCERMVAPERLVGTTGAAAGDPLPKLARIDLDYLVDKKIIPLTKAPCVSANCSWPAADMDASAVVHEHGHGGNDSKTWEYKWKSSDSIYCCITNENYNCEKPHIISGNDVSVNQQERHIVGAFHAKHRQDANLGGLVPVQTRAALTVELRSGYNSALPWPITNPKYDAKCIINGQNPSPADQNNGASLHRHFEHVGKYADDCSKCVDSLDKKCSCVKIPDVCLKPGPQNKCKLI